MTLEHAVIEGPIRIDSESPFVCSFVMRHKKDDVVAVLIGDYARSMYRTLRIGDIIKIEGSLKSGGSMYPCQNQVFVINTIELPQSAITGRNLNIWA